MTIPSLPAKRNWLGLILVGVAVGIASGLFGVGGGIIIVPALVYLLAYDHKVASGTSLLAIVIPAVVGVVSYGLRGDVDYLLALLLAVGSIVGAPIGAWLLKRLEKRIVQIAFICFLVIVIVTLFLVVPSRDAEVHVDLLNGALIVVVGLVAGIAGGLLGIGGGVIVVPALVVLFGASDLVAKGTSLLMIIATGLSGTVANIRHRNVDTVGALTLGLAAGVVTPFSVWLSTVLSPFAANVTFSVFLVLVAIRMIWDVRSQSKK
ncbi:sulfite exporter TauE/SafE family protein [Gulosibacter sediminis]|uniref:sulfite exporter TauE/SafE family protein n=1 Tax=Gulosibacter sediminis TaxID=1729695 RepID=UPI0024AE1D5E|nr:sulfite exporter TauE/SafE family protein [Gulosibacter sediminis]